LELIETNLFIICIDKIFLGGYYILGNRIKFISNVNNWRRIDYEEDEKVSMHIVGT
jgi:hypothetical protein